MIYILDTANLEEIKHCNEFFPISGVTTNPSIISKAKADFWPLVKSIREIIGRDKMLHVQTTQTEAEKIVKEALLLRKELGENTYVKIPVCEEGIKATKLLKDEDVGVTMTAIFTPEQALMSAVAGADFVAPYVNRLENIIGDGSKLVAEIVKEFELYKSDCKVLAASFKNAEQIHKCALSGCHSVTATYDIFKSLISHPMTDIAIEGFNKDWKSVYGEKTILDF